MIKLSASSLRDLFICPKRYEWRTKFSDQGIVSDDMYAGKIVHDLLEHYALDDNLEELARIKVFNENNLVKNKVLISIGNLKNFKYLLSEKDIVENYFELNLYNDLILVGKIDRITQHPIVIDWKTSYKTPRTLDEDIQFIVYSYAYEKMFKKPPVSCMLINLYENSTATFGKNLNYKDIFFNEVLGDVIKLIKQNIFPKFGIYTNQCKSCQFNKVCLPFRKTKKNSFAT